MKTLAGIIALGLLAANAGVVHAADAIPATPVAVAAKKAPAPPALDFKMKDINGELIDLCGYHGKVVLVVNVASKCGLTPQYEGLQALYEKYQKDGFVVLGFPANEFRAQEPGTNAEIKAFCSKNYGVTFEMFSKVVVKGEGICPLYNHLTSLDAKPAGKGDITWNFEKFLIDREGNVVGRFSPRTKPEELTDEIEKELAKK